MYQRFFNDTVIKSYSPGIVAISYYVIGSVGVISNLLVLVVILNFRAMRCKNVNILVINQSVIDMFASALIVVFRHIDRNPYLDAGLWGALVCRVWIMAVPMFSLLMASTINIVWITLERYVAVVHPIRYYNVSDPAKHRLTAIAIATPWILGIAFNCAITSTTSTVRNNRCCGMDFSQHDDLEKTVGVAVFLLEFFLPVAICVVCYARIVLTLRQKVAPHDPTVVASASQEGTASNKAKSNMISNIHKTFGTVVLFAIVCNAPNQCLYLPYNFG